MSLAVRPDNPPGRGESPDPAPDRAAGLAALAASPGPTVGLAVQLGLLVALAATIGLRPAGWTAAGAFALGTRALLGGGLRRAGRRSLGPADVVTLTRAILVGGVVAFAADSLTAPGVPVPVATEIAVVLAAVALALDGVDGAVARRTGTATPLGARFDMEVDAVLILALSILLVRPVGLWVLAVGGMRYAFLVGGRVFPWLAAPLPPRLSRKAVAAGQGVVLVVAVAGVLPHPATVGVVLAALGALCWSFGRDVAWLARSAA
jgi:phosphatidylglycerophosphate synthase